MSFPKYLAYKDSGVEWLGQVPDHWRVDRLKASIISCRNGIWGDEAQDDENDIPCVRVADFNRQTLRVQLEQPTIRSVTEKERINRVLKRGDLLLEKSGGGENQPVGCVVLYDDEKPAVCSNFVAKVELAPGMDSSYWRYVHAAAYDVRLTIGSINQTSGIQNLDQDRYFNERAAYPTAQEQSCIGAFLEREAAKIDALVAEQEQLVTLLKEKRQAVISHAVTKGLDPTVPMKDSGVEWLGEVPAHWAVGKCGFYIRILSGFAFPSSGFSHDEANHRLLRGANVGVSRLKWDDTVFWERSEGDGLDEYEMSEGDLVIGMDRPLISEGMRVAKVTAEDLPSLLLQRVASLKVGPKLHADYLHHLLSSDMFIAHFSPETTGVSVPHISSDQINDFVIPVPPIDEQRAIVEHLSNLTTSYSGLINEAVLSIELLCERRSALISAAVTGQIDVRGLAPAQAHAA